MVAIVPTDLTPDQLAAIYVRAQSGESVKAIARSLGRDDTALYRLLARRYGYRSADFRRAVWAPTLTLPDAATDLAYMAGIVDGEGSIMQGSREHGTGRWWVKVNMQHRGVIEWLASHGGGFYVRKAAPNERSDQYEWNVSRTLDVETLLDGLLPYLRVKRDKAEIALADLRSRLPATHNGRLGQFADGRPFAHPRSKRS